MPTTCPPLAHRGGSSLFLSADRDCNGLLDVAEFTALLRSLSPAARSDDAHYVRTLQAREWLQRRIGERGLPPEQLGIDATVTCKVRMQMVYMHVQGAYARGVYACARCACTWCGTCMCKVRMHVLYMHVHGACVRVQREELALLHRPAAGEL